MSADRAAGVAALLLAALLYLTPLIVAAAGDAPALRRIVLLNVWLGWTVVGWAYCLVLARRKPPAPARRSWTDPSLGDRSPAWLAELPMPARPWASLPRDTVALPMQSPRDLS